VAKAVDERTEVEKKQFDELTDWADQLLRSGCVDIYQQTKESIKRSLDGEEEEDTKKDSGGGGGGGVVVSFAEKPVDMTSKIHTMWEYKGAEDGEVHGPYTTAQILSWRAQGFFTGPTAVRMRQVKSKEEQEKAQPSMDDLMKDLDDDDDEEEEGNGKGGSTTESAWILSDNIDFSLYC